MNRLLDPARAILADLVRKRLWPIAAALVIALVAIPMLMASSSSAPEAPAPSAAEVAAVPEPAPADATTAALREDGGQVRDPFFDPPAPPSEAKAAGDPAGVKPGDPVGPSAAEPAKSAGKPAKSAGKKPAAAPADPKPGSARATKPSRPSVQRSAPAHGTYYRTAAVVGAGTATRPLTRLTPIGGRHDPAAMYLGVMKVGRPYAVFALGRHATSSGDAACAAATRCRIIGLRPGDTQTITLHSADGRNASHYVVHVRSVKPVRTSAARARTMRADVHRHGRSARRAMARNSVVAEALGRVGYRRSAGLLYSLAALDALEQAAR